MKWLRYLLPALVLACGSTLVQARSHVGVVVDVPLWPLYYPAYPVPYYGGYFPPAVVTVPPAPPVYIEQEPAPAAQDYWYHCSKPEGYYPYVKDCPGGWQKVVPQPPPGQ